MSSHRYHFSYIDIPECGRVRSVDADRVVRDLAAFLKLPAEACCARCRKAVLRDVEFIRSCIDGPVWLRGTLLLVQRGYLVEHDRDPGRGLHCSLTDKGREALAAAGLVVATPSELDKAIAAAKAADATLTAAREALARDIATRATSERTLDAAARLARLASDNAWDCVWSLAAKTPIAGAEETAAS